MSVIFRLMFFVCSLFIFFSCSSISNKPNQFEKMIDTTKLYYIESVYSHKFLDIDKGSVDDGANLIQFSFNGMDNQKFKFRLLPDGFYNIISVKSGKYLDVKNNSVESGTNIIQWNCNNAENQKFDVVFQNDGNVNIFSKVSGKCFDVNAGSMENAVSIVQWDYSNSHNQKFAIKIVQ